MQTQSKLTCEINKVTGMVKGVGKQGCSLVVECFNTKQVAQLIQTNCNTQNRSKGVSFHTHRWAKGSNQRN